MSGKSRILFLVELFRILAQRFVLASIFFRQGAHYLQYIVLDIAHCLYEPSFLALALFLVPIQSPRGVLFS